MIGFMKQLNVTALNCKDTKDHLPMDAVEEAKAVTDYAAPVSRCMRPEPSISPKTKMPISVPSLSIASVPASQSSSPAIRHRRPFRALRGS